MLRNLLDASTSLDLLEVSIKEKCGGRMEHCCVAYREFPNARYSRSRVLPDYLVAQLRQ